MNEAPRPASRRIARLVIEELFGPGSPTIDIAFKLEERVTVLHGRNGSGKTITLTLLDALRDHRFGMLAQYPFKQLRIELTDGGRLELEPRGTKGFPWHFEYRLNEGKDLHALYPEDPFGLLGDPGVSHRWGKQDLALGSQITPSGHALLDWLETLPAIKFIKADRLYVRATTPDNDDTEGTDDLDVDDEPKLMIEQLSEQVRMHMHRTDRQYRRISTRLDASLPGRLFAGSNGDIPTMEELEAREQALNEQAARLDGLGLLREQQAPFDRSKLSAEQRHMFSIILDDREQKIGVFRKLADKAQRLITSLNHKIAPKVVRLDLESGYSVTTPVGQPLPLRVLSSGEQHEFVLLHELFFDTEPGSLILIDEPELSLHVTWQTEVLPEMLDTARLADLDIVLATHSPYIVGDHDELMVRLGEPV